MLVSNGYREDCPKYLTSSSFSAIIIKQMKHMIKWLKISAGINLYLSVILTLVLIALVADIVLDTYWHSNAYLEQFINDNANGN